MNNIKSLDVLLVTKLTSLQVDRVTCLECCKYFIAPETATCGHTLCHMCWRGRRSCPSCAAPLERSLLKLNLPMQALTGHVQSLADQFEKLFNVKLDEFDLDIISNEVKSVNDPTKNVKDWLTSSQNHFSPLTNSEGYTQDINMKNSVKLSSSKIQIHSHKNKSISPEKVVYVQPLQEDWDKIEQLPDTEEIIPNAEKLVSNSKPLLPIYDEDEYTIKNPRRSSRKKETNHCDSKSKAPNTSLGKEDFVNSESDIKSNKAKQNWNNVKRMRKEFSKLNKINRSKLNVSIEMCKKTQNTINKPSTEVGEQTSNEKECQQTGLYAIDDETPVYKPDHKEIENVKEKIIDTIEINNVNDSTNKCIDTILSRDQLIVENFKNTSLTTNNKKETKQNISVDTSIQEFSKTNDVDGNNIKKMPFIKKSFLCPRQTVETVKKTINVDNNSLGSVGNDDIEISIKIGNTLTNIVIKKKTNDVQLRVNTDREVQTSLGSNTIFSKNNVISETQNNLQNIEINLANKVHVPTDTLASNNHKVTSDGDQTIQKSVCTKVNTASAVTATAQFEITESVEKELSNVMECEETDINENVGKTNKVPTGHVKTVSSDQKIDNTNVECFGDDLDIFDNGSAIEQHVHLLKNAKDMPSEILVSTAKTNKKNNISNKREREICNEDVIQSSKKLKPGCNDGDPSNFKENNFNNSIGDNDSINYDAVINQVFANIDADIEKSRKDKVINSSVPKPQQTQHILASQKLQIKNINISRTCNQICINDNAIDKYSENIFSNIEKDTESMDVNETNNKEEPSVQNQVDNLLTPGMCQNLIATEDNLPNNVEIADNNICTPYQEPDDSDRSVVEETPQKNESYSKQKKSDLGSVKVNSDTTKNINMSQAAKSVINVSDSVIDSEKSSKDVTAVETSRKLASETPLTINKFVDHITHKSTPVARKSLNFDKQMVDDDDPEQTLCPSSIVAKTTQEKEFMSKAFEQTPKSPAKKPLMERNTKLNQLKFCIAGSCLSQSDLANVKLLCRKHNWKYVDKYTKELTHLVVSVDEDNVSQRSVKYMCALAASKWIVSYEWVEACLKTNLALGENHYEVLDGTGEPGPKRSRVAKRKLFEGITFFCMPPFSVLDSNTLKEILEASGGKVVNEAKAVKATSDAPALLLAEPEQTQEDRFMYLALELGIVPVNYEWVLNCLGSYSLSSIHDLLLCPSALLPQATAKWPDVLMSRDSE